MLFGETISLDQDHHAKIIVDREFSVTIIKSYTQSDATKNFNIIKI